MTYATQIELDRLGNWAASARQLLRAAAKADPVFGGPTSRVIAFRELFRSPPVPFPCIDALKMITPLLRSLAAATNAEAAQAGALLVCIAADLVLRHQGDSPTEQIAEIPVLSGEHLAYWLNRSAGQFVPGDDAALVSATGRLNRAVEKARAGFADPLVAAQELSGLVIRLEAQTDEAGLAGREIVLLVISYLRIANQLTPAPASPLDDTAEHTPVPPDAPEDTLTKLVS